MKRVVLVLLVLLGVASGVTLAELASRFLVRSHSKSYMVPDPILHHRLRRSITRRVLGVEFSTNSLALRDREYPVPRPEGVHRILMLGDSFTEGGGLALGETVAKRVEAALHSGKCAARYEVINAGVASYSPILEYLLLKRVGLQLQPDLIVLNFDMTDVHDDFIRTSHARFDPNGLPLAVLPDRRVEAALLLPPVPKPRFLRFLDPLEIYVNRLKIYHDFRQSKLGQRWFGNLNLTPEQLEERGLVGKLQYDRMAITRDGDFPGLREAWALTERYLVGISTMARQRGIPFVLVVYPHAHQVSATESPEGRRKFGIGPGVFLSERPFRILEDLGRREGFPVINLLRLFRERAAAEGPLFRRDDIHHTAQGARLFAEGILTGLQERRLIPCARVESTTLPPPRAPETNRVDR